MLIAATDNDNPLLSPCNLIVGARSVLIKGRALRDTVEATGCENIITPFN